jgi:hypothetical protein
MATTRRPKSRRDKGKKVILKKGALRDLVTPRGAADVVRGGRPEGIPKPGPLLNHNQILTAD